jgi:hypothetical protein
MLTATSARIRRSIRENEYARATDIAVLAQRPDANDGYTREREGFCDTAADAQILLNELVGILMVDRFREAVETASPFKLGSTLPLTPTLPRARLVDKTTGFDRTMIIKGVAIDLGLDRNAIEVLG